MKKCEILIQANTPIYMNRKKRYLHIKYRKKTRHLNHQCKYFNLLATYAFSVGININENLANILEHILEQVMRNWQLGVCHA